MRFFKFITVTLALLCCANCPKAEGADVSKMPDFRAIFKQLAENRVIYNSTNDSLFVDTSEEEWLSLALRRSETNNRMYEVNQSLIDETVYYFLLPSARHEDATSGNLKFRQNIPDEAFDSLRSAMFDYKECLDPFLGELLVGNILIPHLETQDVHDPKIAANMAHDYYCYGDCLYSIFCMGDSTALPKAYNMFRKSIHAAHYFPHEGKEFALSVFSACHLLSRPRLNDEGGLRVTEADSIYSNLVQLLDDTNVRKMIEESVPFAYNRAFYNMAQHYPFYRIRSLILEEKKISAEARIELDLRLSLMREIIGMTPVSMQPDSLNVLHSTRFLVRARSGLMSYDAALDSCRTYYRDWNHISIEGEDFTDYFRHFVYVAKDMMHLCQHSTHSALYRNEMAISVCKQATSILLLRPHGELSSQETNLLMILLLDPNLFNNLEFDDRVQYMRQFLGVTQIQTLAHNDCVVWLSYYIIKAVLDQHPEALVGVMGTKTVDEVLKRSDDIVLYTVQGGFIHDLGKLRMGDVITNEYRHLTDHEFELIKLHPEYAAGMLRLLPEYLPYIDFAMGHHRWYDGSNGYPMSYDNTKSKDRILVDILTLADCLEAATNRLSRNYRRHKTFEATMSEFKRDAGSRYNPLVVESVVSSPETAMILKEKITSGWRSTYGSIFERMIQK